VHGKQFFDKYLHSTPRTVAKMPKKNRGEEEVSRKPKRTQIRFALLVVFVVGSPPPAPIESIFNWAK
jgi:hypothetical protein